MQQMLHKDLGLIIATNVAKNVKAYQEGCNAYLLVGATKHDDDVYSAIRIFKNGKCKGIDEYTVNKI